jgi:hypothetical protein
VTFCQPEATILPLWQTFLPFFAPFAPLAHRLQNEKMQNENYIINNS